MSNLTNPLILNPISQISLNSSQYGVDLNERLIGIDDNFNAIMASDFLKGADGKDLCVIEWNVGEDITGLNLNAEELNDSISTAIDMIDLRDNDWIDLDNYGFEGKKIYLICKDEGTTKTIISSLPFTYLDPRFSTNLKKTDIASLANKTDRSCILVFDKNLGDHGGFQAIQTFPTIYFDSTIGEGELCWKINGEKTGLVCKGPAGKDGKSGNIAVVIVDKNRAEKPYYDILGVYQYNTRSETSEFIQIGADPNNEILIDQGQLLICFEGYKTSAGEVHLTKNEEGLVGDYFLTYAYVGLNSNNQKTYGAYAGSDEIRVNAMLSMASLKGMLDMIGYTTGPNSLDGLYVPSDKSDGVVNNAHAFYNDPNGDLHIGEVNPSDFSSNPNGDLHIDYPKTFMNETHIGDCYLSPSSNGYDPCKSKSMTLQEAITKSGYVSLTYDELVFKRNSKQLVPGCFYRITDYITTTSQARTKSAGHPFDIIVLALSNNTLSEEAWATGSVNDLYFRNSNLHAWKIWYCLDNDTSRFAWAGGVTDNQMNHSQSFTLDVRKHIFVDYDGGSAPDFLPISGWSKAYGQNGVLVPVLYNTYEGRDGNRYDDQYFYVGDETDDGITYNKWLNIDPDESLNDNEGHYILTDLIYKDSKMFHPGKGVIYRMIDEFGNDCPYDFKNIKTYDGVDYRYTFAGSSYYFHGSPSDIPGDDEDWSISGKIKGNIINSNINYIPAIYFNSYVSIDVGGSSYDYCCDNNVINSNNVTIRGENNTVMNSNNIGITGDNCNIPSGSNGLKISGTRTYLSNIDIFDDYGLLNEIRTAGKQIMIIPKMEVFEGELHMDNGGLNFSIENNIRKMGTKNNPLYCVIIPNNISTVIVRGLLTDGNPSYIVLPYCSIGHTIDIISTVTSSDTDYQIMTPLFHSGDADYQGYTLLDSKGDTVHTLQFQATKDNPIIHLNNIEYKHGYIMSKYVALKPKSYNRFIYTGSEDGYSSEGIWMKS